MANTPFTIQQEIFLEEHPEILVESCHLGANGIKSLLPGFLASVRDNIVGLASIHGRRKCISRLVLSTTTRVLIIDMSSTQKNKDMLRKFLLDKTIIKSAFEMDKLAAALHIDFLLHINNAKDLLSVTKSGRHSLDAVMGALGGETTLSKRAVINIFQHEEKATIEPKAAALQAWAACCACTIPSVACRLVNVVPIYTTSIDPRVLTLISKTIREGDRLLALKPTRVKHDFDNSVKSNPKSGTITVTSKRYKTRMMPTAANQFVRIDTVQADGTVTATRGRTKHVQGKTVKLSIAGGIGNTEIQSLHTIGRESPTSAETLRTHCMLEALEQTIMLSTHPFINVMWFPIGNVKAKALWKDTTRLSGTPSFSFPGDRKLNASQLKAVKISLSSKNSDRVILIHGPPGTGKTTVIAATVTSVMSLSDKDRTLWLVAQSNVAVKNIAEKLASVDFIDFKVLVSKDFHFDWHEHLYKKIEHNVLRSDNFAKTHVEAERQLLGSRVILCTLSMLSNDKIHVFTHFVPIQTVIFDEASQIEIGDYLPMLIRFRPSLRKLIFIGDNKQLAPYGSNDIPTLQSIFEKSHMLKKAVFLDTQYRMPIPIGEFISKHVYCGKLRSQHPITSTSSCRFVDVCDGVEASQGHSWVNLREVAVVIKIARQLTSAGKSFRVITPYDPQRSFLENGLKDAGLPWEDKCFNIDAFQGNEDDYIIISLVRSEKLGFLTDERRVNVMLTRCKMGMIICSSRMFLQGPAAHTLVGKMFAKFGHSNLVEGVRVLRGEVQPFD